MRLNQQKIARKTSGVKLEVTFPDGHKEIFKSISSAAREIGIKRQEIHRYLREEYKHNNRGFKFNTNIVE